MKIVCGICGKPWDERKDHWRRMCFCKEGIIQVSYELGKPLKNQQVISLSGQAAAPGIELRRKKRL